MLNLLKNQIALLFSGTGWKHNSDEIVITLNHKNRMLAFSKHAPSFLGVTSKSLKGQSFFRLIAGENQDDFAEILNFIRRANAEKRPNKDTLIKKTYLTLTPASTPRLRCHVSIQMGTFDTVKLLISEAPMKKTDINSFNTNASNSHHQEKLHNSTPPPPLSSSPISPDRLADLSHEMKTPLNAIIGFTDSMREETFGPIENEKYKEYLDYIHNSGMHLMSLVSSVLDMAKIDANRYCLKPVSTNIADLAQECITMLLPKAKEAGLKIILDTDKNIGDSLMDPLAVRQILINLLSNAVKFTSDGEIRLTTTLKNGMIEINVRDTGMGMNEEQLKQLGTRFTTAQGDGVRGAKGNGLGLSLSSSLAQLHGGNLQFDSAPGEGLTATLSLPFVPLLSRDHTQNINGHHEWAGTHIVNKDVQSLTQSSNYVSGKSAALQTQMERIDNFRKKVGAKQGADAA